MTTTTPTADFAAAPFQAAYSREDAEYVVIEAATGAILSYHGNGAQGHQRAYEAAAGLNYEAALTAAVAQADEQAA